MTPPALTVEGLDVFYGASQILFGVGFTLREGQTMALLGRNGAGKSTTMKAIAGLAPPRAGAIRLGGRDIAGTPPYLAARLGLAFVPEDRQVFPDHTVQDNLEIAAKRGPAGEDHWTVPRIWEALPLLERLRGRAAGRLSGGEQQMLAIARALMSRPRLLLLDEPSLGLAPLVVKQIFDVVRDLNRLEGLTVFLVEQNAWHSLKLAHRAYVMVNGAIALSGTGAELLANPQVRAAYLEGGAKH